MALFKLLFAALNQVEFHYIVVGGAATVLHGYSRLTADVDLVIDLEPVEARRAIEVLTELGFQPRLPVTVTDFADPPPHPARLGQRQAHEGLFSNRSRQPNARCRSLRRAHPRLRASLEQVR